MVINWKLLASFFVYEYSYIDIDIEEIIIELHFAWSVKKLNTSVQDDGYSQKTKYEKQLLSAMKHWDIIIWIWNEFIDEHYKEYIPK